MRRNKNRTFSLPTTSASRRNFLKTSTLTASGVLLAGPLQALFVRQSQAASDMRNSPLGKLSPVKDLATGLELLQLPPKFEYTSFSWAGDLMSNGTSTPLMHDGMGVVQVTGSANQQVVLIRNHENAIAPLLGAGTAPTYDDFRSPKIKVEGLGGGTTSMVFDVARFELQSVVPTLAGTLANCAGGPTPWKSWLSCEEATILGERIGAKRHGYVYEVPSPLISPATAQPIVEMGLMDHEAAAVDPATSKVYLTEDNGPSGFYRFTPKDTSQKMGSLANGGTLEMLKVAGSPNANLIDIKQGDSFDVEWVVIDDPNKLPATEAPTPIPGTPPISFAGPSGPYAQGYARGAAKFSRLEGCCHDNGVIYFTDTTSGPAQNGAVWAYIPEKETLTAIFVSPNANAIDKPDNITVAPKGGIVVCEDSENPEGTRLIGVSQNGKTFDIVRNNMVVSKSIASKPLIPLRDYRRAEFAGVTFDPKGEVLFVNIQVPGVTFAIRGPWNLLGSI